MFILSSYAWAVVFTVVTMFCWGSWANTQKLAPKNWRFELFYWDYTFGVFLFSLIFGLTLGSMGGAGRSFIPDLLQASRSSIVSALLGGMVFNIANILLVAAIDIAGMAVAFPVGIGIALVLGVIVNYIANPIGSPVLLFSGVGLVVVAIVMDAMAYRKLPRQAASVSGKGLVLSVSCGLLMGFFYRFVAAAMSPDFGALQSGKMGPYAAVFVFSIGVLLSNAFTNTYIMKKPFRGQPVSAAAYFQAGLGTHAIGILGGLIWGVGMSLNILASGAAGFAISYGLGQGSTMVAALWGVFVWKEFKAAPAGTGKLIALMFCSFIAGLALIILSRRA
jgi:glucose uptake protein